MEGNKLMGEPGPKEKLEFLELILCLAARKNGGTLKFSKKEMDDFFAVAQGTTYKIEQGPEHLLLRVTSVQPK